MGVEIRFVYEGELRCRAQHDPSGTEFVTDAPVDNEGRGESFSPTDLVATALGSCMLTTMGIAARRRGFDIPGATAQVTKEMIADPRRRIASLRGTIRIPGSFSDNDRKLLELAAATCPVSQSLAPQVEVAVTIEWAE